MVMRKNVLSYIINIDSTTTPASWQQITTTIPFGTSQKKRIIKKIWVSFWAGSSIQINTDQLRVSCPDFNINHNRDATISSTASDSETITATDIIVNNQNGAGGTYNTATVCNLQQPWISSDLVVFYQCKFNTTVTSFQLILNIEYEEQEK